MHAEVKRCADNNDIKSLRYIFVDCLDVDPTFEKYKEDYDYCKNIEGFFDSFVEISPVISDKSRWNMQYWAQLKFDLMKNFSSKRFEHMIEVAKVVHADKVARLSAERSIQCQKAPDKIKIENSRGGIKTPVMKIEESRRASAISQKAEINSINNQRTIVSQAYTQNQIIRAKQRQMELYNQGVEAKQRQQQERIEAAKRVEEAKKYNANNVTSSKKWVGIALMAIVLVVVVLIAVL